MGFYASWMLSSMPRCLIVHFTQIRLISVSWGVIIRGIISQPAPSIFAFGFVSLWADETAPRLMIGLGHIDVTYRLSPVNFWVDIIA